MVCPLIGNGAINGGDVPGPASCRRCARRCPSRCSIKVLEYRAEREKVFPPVRRFLLAKILDRAGTPHYENSSSINGLRVPPASACKKKAPLLQGLMVPLKVFCLMVLVYQSPLLPVCMSWFRR